LSAHGNYDETHHFDGEYLYQNNDSDILQTLNYNFSEHVITVRQQRDIIQEVKEISLKILHLNNESGS